MKGLRFVTATGEIGELFAASARSLARRATVTRPSPSGADSWSHEDINDLVYDMVVRVRPDAIVLAAQEAESDVSFVTSSDRIYLTTFSLLRILRCSSTTMRLSGRSPMYGARITVPDSAQTTNSSASWSSRDELLRTRGQIVGVHYDKPIRQQ